MTGKWGEAASLARHLGVTNTIVSKILSGYRKVQAHEVPLILSFFGVAGTVDQLAALEARVAALEARMITLEKERKHLKNNQ